ncbi:MAG: hypothetical protein K0R03_415 [Moraxellaceae bacterium]|jgi:hypothetical protein|nr:hypothetical protein [Moraxellaceae bacterium]MDF3029857.1 hypothetical protein [Moraxellaceae bacterium]
MNDDLPREPMPKSFRPAWIYIGLMGGVVVVMGIVSAIIALLVQ